MVALMQSGAFTFSRKGQPLMKPLSYTVGQYAYRRPVLLLCQNDSIGVKTVLPAVPTECHKQKQELGGIGIVKFFQGKNIFITGATGFLAKVLVEKLLRSVPDVGKIYVMINADNMEAATKRLKNEILNADVFKCLKQVHGKSYESFMLNKLIPVAGNLCEPDLGFDKTMEATMVEHVDIIINSAANTSFRERFDVAFDVNVKGPQKVMAFAQQCKKLILFLQISTAYVNGQRQGKIMEKPFRTGETVTMENYNSFQFLNIEDEIHSPSILPDINATQKMKMLGLQRANIYGWENIYVFTKAMGEMLLGSSRGDVPLVILRPSIIGSTCTDPFPGWIEGNRMLDPVITFYGKGQIFGLPSNPDCTVDMIPVDMVINAALAAIAKHGKLRKLSIVDEVPVYQVASSVANPLLWKDFGILVHQNFTDVPFLDSKGEPIIVKPYNFYSTIEEYLSHVESETMKSENTTRKFELFRKKTMLLAKYIGAIYEPYGFYGGRFDNTNTDSLIKIMSEEEKRVFHFNIGSIDWKDYMVNVHIPGLRKHVLKC